MLPISESYMHTPLRAIGIELIKTEETTGAQALFRITGELQVCDGVLVILQVAIISAVYQSDRNSAKYRI